MCEVTKQEEALWLRWLIPLPKEISIPRKVTLPAGEVSLRLRQGASDVEKHAATELTSLFRAKADVDLSRGSFEILLGVCDEEGRLEGRMVPGAEELPEVPNSEQAYIVRPRDEDGLVLTALDERGIYYAARTLYQLLEDKFADGQVTIPLATISDWPDISERGQWRPETKREVEGMTTYKLNLLEKTANLSFDERGKGIAQIDQELIDHGRLRALKVVPIILHLDYLDSTGLFDHWPEIMGQGEKAWASVEDKPVALCFSQPKTTEILADWMTSLAAQPGVTDINVWLSEYEGQCQCPQCTEAAERGLPQHAREAQAVGDALQMVQRSHPWIRARVLLSQGSYPHNEEILAAMPPTVDVSYYCGVGWERSTYNSSPEPIVYPIMEDYAADHWLGVYPQFTASWGTVCPWSGPQFVRYRMCEFVEKGIDCVCGYAVPNNELHQFNIAAAAEWSWNLNGRSEREFAIAWATRHGIREAEALGDWVEILGPVSWNIYGAGPAATPFLTVLGESAQLVAEGRRPVLGEGIWRYYQQPEDLSRDMEACERALEIAERLDAPEILYETRVVQAYAVMVNEIFAVGMLLSESASLSDEARGELQQCTSRLAMAGTQATDALNAWKEGICPGLRADRFDSTVQETRQTVVTIMDALTQLGVKVSDD